MFKKKNIVGAIPYMALIIGILLFIYGTFNHFESLEWKDFWAGLGKTILASGIFALLLKTVQFMGVFKEELSKVVYDPKFLANRKDLEEIWEGVSKVLFKNKFPKISKEVTHDIGHLYFPTDHVLYYDDYKQIIEIEMIDSHKEIVKVMQHSTFYVYPKSKTEKFLHKTSNDIQFEKDRSEVSFDIKKFLINGEEKSPTVTTSVDKTTLKTFYEIELKGEDFYKFETCIEKKYSLIYDNAVGTIKDFLIHDFSLKLHLKGGIKIDFYNVGTLKKFKIVGVTNENYREYEYTGMIYPKQGYLFFIKKK